MAGTSADASKIVTFEVLNSTSALASKIVTFEVLFSTAISASKVVTFVVLTPAPLPSVGPIRRIQRALLSEPDPDMERRPGFQWRVTPTPAIQVTPLPAPPSRVALNLLYREPDPTLPITWPTPSPSPAPAPTPTVTDVFGYVLPIDPRFIDVDRWTSEMSWTLAPFGSVPALRMGMEWQAWARYVNSLPGISAVLPPMPERFESWQGWAAAFNEKIVYARYRL